MRIVSSKGIEKFSFKKFRYVSNTSRDRPISIYWWSVSWPTLTRKRQLNSYLSKNIKCPFISCSSTRDSRGKICGRFLSFPCFGNSYNSLLFQRQSLTVAIESTVLKFTWVFRFILQNKKLWYIRKSTSCKTRGVLIRKSYHSHEVFFFLSFKIKIPMQISTLH